MFSYVGDCASVREKELSFGLPHEGKAQDQRQMQYLPVDAGQPQDFSQGHGGGLGGHSRSENQIWQLEETTEDAVVLLACSLEDSSIDTDFWVYYQFFFAILLQSLTLLLQVMITFMLFATVVEQSEDLFEHDLSGDIAALRNATSHGVPLNRSTAGVNLCHNDKTLCGTREMVIFVWVSRMTRVFSQGVARVIVYIQMPSSDEVSLGSREVVDERIEYGNHKGKRTIEKESYSIIALTFRLRMFFIFFLGLGHVCATIFLTWTSAKYLILEGSTEKVLLKAISMQFIIMLDGMMFKSFMPSTFVKKIRSSRIECGTPRPPLWRQWSMVTCYLLLAGIFTWCMFCVLFARLGDFRSACRSYFERFPHERKLPSDLISALIQSYWDPFLQKEEKW